MVLPMPQKAVISSAVLLCETPVQKAFEKDELSVETAKARPLMISMPPLLTITLGTMLWTMK